MSINLSWDVTLHTVIINVVSDVASRTMFSARVTSVVLMVCPCPAGEGEVLEGRMMWARLMLPGSGTEWHVNEHRVRWGDFFLYEQVRKLLIKEIFHSKISSWSIITFLPKHFSQFKWIFFKLLSNDLFKSECNRPSEQNTTSLSVKYHYHSVSFFHTLQ